MDIYKLAGILFLSALLTACKESRMPIEQALEQGVPQQQTMPTNSNAVDSKRPCLSKKSPPIKDKNKIKEMLFASGKITADMTEEQKNKVVNNFIRNKQTQTRNCNKK